MSIGKKHVEWLAVALFLAVIGLVYQQAATSMAEQGIASGGPYDNAAAYPKTIAAVLALLTAIQALLQILRARRAQAASEDAVPLGQLARPASLVLIFAAYLAALGIVGYHIATPIMLAALMLLCGIRRPLATVAPAVLISLGFSYIFEAWLKIVLPGGLLHLNIAW